MRQSLNLTTNLKQLKIQKNEMNDFIPKDNYWDFIPKLQSFPF